jgi:hypothetical protein
VKVRRQGCATGSTEFLSGFSGFAALGTEAQEDHLGWGTLIFPGGGKNVWNWADRFVSWRMFCPHLFSYQRIYCQLIALMGNRKRKPERNKKNAPVKSLFPVTCLSSLDIGGLTPFSVVIADLLKLSLFWDARATRVEKMKSVSPPGAIPQFPAKFSYENDLLVRL